MQRVLRILFWQWAFLIFALAVLVGVDFSIESSITGSAVSQTNQTDQFAPPYDAFTGRKIISLEYTPLDEERFTMQVAIAEEDGMIYTNIYYHTLSGWQRFTLPGATWSEGRTSVTITESYDNFELREGDDFYIGAWACKGVDGAWRCGCKTSADCGYWHLQGVDLEGTIPISTCIDTDGDQYGVTSSDECIFMELDCDDTDAAVNPDATEVPYNGIDDDCDDTTRDDDIDHDGYLLSDDCDDDDASRHPSAAETCDDGIDQDCDGADETCEQCGEGAIPMSGCVCEAMSKYSGYCCDNDFQYAACGTPEVIFYDGFESGTANTWDYLNPYSKVNGDNPYAGLFGLDFIYMSGSSALKKDQHASVSLEAERHLFLRYYVYFEQDFVHSVDGLRLSSFGTDEWQVEQLVRLWQGDPHQGRISLIINGVEEATSKVVTNGRWYCIEEEVFADSQGLADGIVRVWVDDTAIYDQDGKSFADGSDIDYLKQGGLYTGSFGDVPIHVYVDNVVVSLQRVGCS